MPNLDSLAPYVNELIFSFDVGPQRSGTYFCFHLDYQETIYRQQALVALLRDSIEYFALTHEEFEEFREAEDLVAARRVAWSRISNARKNQKGDYGELLLYLLLSFKLPNRIPRFVTKVRLRSSRGDQIKGFDCAHVTYENNQIYLWLGEAKFHQSLSGAIASATSSLREHCEGEYLINELKILGANCEANHGIDEIVSRELDLALNKGRSLDRLNFRIPVLLTYDSDCVKNNTSICDAFREQLTAELNTHFTTLEEQGLRVPQNFSLLFFLMPFRMVADVKSALEKIEEAMQ